MMRRTGLLYACLGACALPAAAFALCPGIYPRWLYVLQAVAEWCLGTALLLLAVQAVRRGRERTARALLCAASGLAALALFDLWVVSFRVDTSGPGGRYCATHAFWMSRFVRNNAAGFWERELEPWTRPAVARPLVIAAVGDSFTWGQGAAGRERRFGDILERSLVRATGRDVVVLNFGRPGINTTAETAIIQESVAAVRPDVVLLCYLFNDIEPRVVRAVPAAVDEGMPRLLRFSPALNLLYWRAVAPRAYARFGSAYVANYIAAYMDEADFERHARQLEQAVAAIRRVGARPAVAVLPAPFFWTDETRPYRDTVLSRLRRVIARTGAPSIPLHDVEDELGARRFALSPIDAHPSHAAHRAIAERLAAWFLANPEYLQPPAARPPTLNGHPGAPR